MKVWIDRDEWFPVYALITPIPDWAEDEEWSKKYVVEIPEKKLRQLTKEYEAATKRFMDIQEKLAKLSGDT